MDADRTAPLITGREAVERENMRWRMRVLHLQSVLESIANADPRKWDPEVRDQFQAWAQNRARHALSQVGAGDTATEPHNAEVTGA